jgi:hypothetical protein
MCRQHGEANGFTRRQASSLATWPDSLSRLAVIGHRGCKTSGRRTILSEANYPGIGQLGTALGLRPTLSVFGTDYPTPDGTCIRDYIHVSDLIAAHRDALAHLRAGGASATLNCGYGRGFSVLEVIESVKRVSGVDFKVEFTGRRAGDPAQLVAACDRIRTTLDWEPHFNDLQTIVTHALTWERKLSERADRHHRPGDSV